MIFQSKFFYLALLAVVVLFVTMTSFNGLYGQDAYEYFRYTNALHNYFTSGKSPGYFFWSYMYPFTAAILSFIFPVVNALQLISILCFILTFFFTEKLLTLFYPDKQNSIRIYLTLFLFLSPFSLRCSITCMSDSLCLCFIMSSFYYFTKFFHGNTNSFLYAVFFASCACATRYAAVVILFLPCIYALKTLYHNFNLRITLYSIIVVVIVLTPIYLLKNGNFQNLVPHYFIFGWDALNLFKTTFFTADGRQGYSLPNIVYCFSNLFSPGYFFIGLVLLFFVKKSFFQNPFLKIIMLSWFAYSIFIGGIPFQNNRVLLLSFPLVLISLFPAAETSYNHLKQKTRHFKSLLLMLAFIQLALFTRAFIPFYNYNRNEQKIINFITQLPQSTLYTSEMTAAVNAFKVNQTVIDLWKEPLRQIKTPAFLLVNIEKFKKQWTGMNVMNNYNFIASHFQLRSLKKFEGGWELYEIR